MGSLERAFPKVRGSHAAKGLWSCLTWLPSYDRGFMYGLQDTIRWIYYKFLAVYYLVRILLGFVLSLVGYILVWMSTHKFWSTLIILIFLGSLIQYGSVGGVFQALWNDVVEFSYAVVHDLGLLYRRVEWGWVWLVFSLLLLFSLVVGLLARFSQRRKAAVKARQEAVDGYVEEMEALLEKYDAICLELQSGTDRYYEDEGRQYWTEDEMKEWLILQEKRLAERYGVK